MTEQPITLNQTLCQIYEINYNLATTTCDRCGQLAGRFTTASRTAIDLALDHPILLQLTVSVHHCEICHHYFRVQPPFLRPDAIYTNRVVIKAVQSVYQDQMAVRRVVNRLARDFWVQPSERMLRHWCRTYGATFDFEIDYQPWVVSEFSGILCVDEVYQGKLALLLAVDPAATDGDRLVGYQLITGAVDADDVEIFLTRLKAAGIEPAEVITDGSSLYPAVLSQVWPKAAHQLCLFHETRHVTKGVMKLINAVRRSLPAPPSTSTQRGARALRRQPANDDPNDRATQRWQRRQAERERQIALVHHLADQGLSQRAIARQTGFSRPTVKKWLRLNRPALTLAEILTAPNQSVTDIPSPTAVKRAKMRQTHELAQEHLSYSEIARRVGAHRVTVKKWLQDPVPPEEEPAVLTLPVQEVTAPPVPWTDWEQVRQTREALKEHRFLFLRRPEHLNEIEQVQMAELLASPVGPELQIGRDCLVEWYLIWQDEKGQRRTLTEARSRYETWQTSETYRAIPALRQVQQRITPGKFDQLSQFLQQPEWEATNNGAERTGRAFRHRQAPHFNLRSHEAIGNTLKVMACLRKEAATTPPASQLHTCQRGRTPTMLSIPVTMENAEGIMEEAAYL
jgi:DNA-binding CsgD family transcriptional regulator